MGIIRTVFVICRVGVIEWVRQTQPLKDFLQDALNSDEERKNYLYAFRV